MSFQFRRLACPVNRASYLLAHRWYVGLWVLGILGTLGVMLIERFHAWSVWIITDHLAIDFAFVPLTVLFVLVPTGFLARRWNVWWPRVAVLVGVAIQLGIEIRQLDGYILPVYPHPTGAWIVLDFFARHFGSSFDWNQMVTISVAGVVTWFMVVFEQRVASKAQVLPGWCIGPPKEGDLHHDSQETPHLVVVRGGNSNGTACVHGQRRNYRRVPMPVRRRKPAI